MFLSFFPQTISGDINAETLTARYEPHVCLTRDALVKLLDNHGPQFEEQWEIPVWVKLNPGKGTESEIRSSESLNPCHAPYKHPV